MKFLAVKFYDLQISEFGNYVTNVSTVTKVYMEVKTARSALKA